MLPYRENGQKNDDFCRENLKKRKNPDGGQSFLFSKTTTFVDKFISISIRI